MGIGQVNCSEFHVNQVNKVNGVNVVNDVEGSKQSAGVETSSCVTQTKVVGLICMIRYLLPVIWDPKVLLNGF